MTQELRRSILFIVAVVLTVMAAYAVSVGTRHIDYGQDDLEYTLPMYYLALPDIETNRLHQWIDSTDMGTPAWTKMPALTLFYPFLGLFARLEPDRAMAAMYLILLALGATGMFLLLKRLGCSPKWSFAGTIWFTLSGQVTMQVDQGYSLVTISSMSLPWFVLGLEAGLSSSMWKALFAGIALAAALAFGHLPVDAVVLFTAMAYCLARGFFMGGVQGLARGIAVFAIGTSSGLALSAFAWWPALSDLLSNALPRQYQTSTLSWSSPWRILTYLFPLSGPGRKGVEFIGTVPLFLLVTSMLSFKSKRIFTGLFIAAAGLLVIVSPKLGLLEYVRDIAPPFKMLSHVWFFGLTFTFGSALSASLAASETMVHISKRPWKSSGAACIISFTSLALVVLSLSLPWIVETGSDDQSVLTGVSSSLPWVVSIGLVIALIFAGARRGMIRPAGASWIVFFMAVLEMVVFSNLAIHHDHDGVEEEKRNPAALFDVLSKSGPSARVLIEQSATHERDWVLRKNECLTCALGVANMSAKVAPRCKVDYSNRLDGFSLLYKELSHASKGGSDPKRLKARLLSIQPGSVNHKLLDLANVGYIATDRGRKIYGGVFEHLMDWSTASVWYNPNVLPYARIVHRARFVGEDEIMDLLAQPGHDPRTEVLLASRGQGEPEPGFKGDTGQSEIVDLSRETDRIAVLTRSDSAGYLVLSESWHKYWQARVDGSPVTVFPAEGCFMAVPVPAGEHLATLLFKPPVMGPVAFSLGWFLCLVVVFVRLSVFKRLKMAAH